ncbi:hypothetical protein pipiens_007786 [Culex pipiens pipiens]|uniref:Uncharacterized protein n=1 Tax=Culex pipiens pipiens TaxID=38569 RepID=A0ABD1DJV9_CULPP
MVEFLNGQIELQSQPPFLLYLNGRLPVTNLRVLVLQQQRQPTTSEVPLFQIPMSSRCTRSIRSRSSIQLRRRRRIRKIVTGKITAEVSNLENSFKLMGILISTEPAPAQVLSTSSLLFLRDCVEELGHHP